MTPVVDLRGDPSRHRRERRVRALLLAAAVVTVMVSLGIVLSLLGEATAFFRAIISDSTEGLASLNANGWLPRRGRFQIVALLAHTGIVTLIAMAVAIPFGLGSAIYLSEYAKPRVRRFLKPTLEVLAGIPSVVLGFFAIQFVTPFLVRGLFPTAQVNNFLAAGICVGVLVIPLVASVAEDAMRAVPRSMREAAFGLGAKRWHTSLRVVFPAALSGVMAAIILAFSRAVGETMIVALAAGAGGILNLDPLEGGLTMTGAMAQLAIGSDQVTGATGAFQSLFLVGLVLFVITLALNIASERVVRRFRQRY